MRLLQKANNLQPDDAEIMAVKARADKEMAAVLREAREERDERRASQVATPPAAAPLPLPAPAPMRAADGADAADEAAARARRARLRAAISSAQT